jgi:hypothetical protein
MKNTKLACLLFSCLFITITVRGQISATPLYTEYSDDFQLFPETLPADSGFYMVITYVDGTAENYCAWQLAGNMNAVKFSFPSNPPSPLTVAGAMIYVGNGSFPVGGNFLNQPFHISVYDDDGDNGMPGTLIDSISALAINYEWIRVTGLNSLITSDFYIVMTQLSNSPDCVPLGVDETMPKANRSYSRNVQTGNPWVISPYQDFMINALISTKVGLEEVKSIADVKISPNPANETLKIEFSVPMKSIAVINSTGQVLLEENITNQTSCNFNTSFYLSGVYYIRFTTAGGDSFIRKLVVVH